jgi:hypothetical protein
MAQQIQEQRPPQMAGNGRIQEQADGRLP